MADMLRRQLSILHSTYKHSDHVRARLQSQADQLNRQLAAATHANNLALCGRVCSGRAAALLVPVLLLHLVLICLTLLLSLLLLVASLETHQPPLCQSQIYRRASQLRVNLASKNYYCISTSFSCHKARYVLQTRCS